MRQICNFIIKMAIYGLVFLIPLFWLPGSIEAFEFNKQYLLVFLVGLALLAWLVKMIVVQKRFVLRRTPLDIWILFFMVVMVLSAIFSIDEISSWLGFYGRFSDAVVGILALCLMYFLVVNNLKTEPGARSLAESAESSDPPQTTGERMGLIPRQGGGSLGIEAEKAKELGQSGPRKGILSLDKMLSLFLTSVWLIVIIAYLSIFGFWSKIPGLPRLMSFQSFNPINGSLEGLSIFLVVVVSLVIGILLQRTKSRPERKIFLITHYLLFSAAALLLILIDFRAAWLALGGTMLILVILAVWTRLFRKRVNLLILPIILFLISLAGLTGLIIKVKDLTGSDFLRAPLPQEVILNYQTAGQITWQAFKEYPVLGSGPATFLVDFAKFKPADFNQNQFWSIRFDKGPSYLMEIISTTGILGSLSYLIIVVIFGLIIFAFLRRVSKETILLADKAVIILSLFLCWLALLISQFVYLNNLVLAFYFWLSMALVMVLWQAAQGNYREISFSFKKLPEVGLVMNVILLIIVFVLAGSFYLAVRFYWADIKFNQPTADNEQLIQNLEKAVNLNKYRENYRRSLSQVYLINAWTEARKPAEEQNVQLLQAYATGAIQQARVATLLSPNSVSAWENLGAIYRDCRGLVGGTLPFALDSFNQALELEPTNPFFYRELCRINLISEERDWDKTIGYCQRAIDLKADYLDAHIQLALVYEEKGDLEEAANRLKGALDKLRGVSFQRGSRLAGAAAEIYFQLGRVNFNLEQVDEAVNMFEQSVIVMPEYANARYALALSYQVRGRLEDALTQYQIVNQLVPGNEEVLARIQQLTEQLTPQVPTPTE